MDPPHFDADPDSFFYADAVLDLYPTFHPDPDLDPDPSFQDFFCTNNVGPNLGGP